MSVKELKAELIRRIGISRQAVEARVKNIKKYGPFSTDVAYGIVAHIASIDPAKFISDQDILSSIRDGLDRIAQIDSETIIQKPKTIVKTVTINIGKQIKLNDPILDKKILDDARDMTTTYAELYVFENSVRELINLVLSKQLGSNWWNNANISKDLLDKVQGRIDKEAQNPWHGRRGAHPIYYSDISDLIYIIRRHWKLFSDFFPRLEWISEKLEQISFSRNVVDHHNPLSKHDRDRLTINLQDWQNQINAKKSLL
jgi:hypothetical protein